MGLAPPSLSKTVNFIIMHPISCTLPFIIPICCAMRCSWKTYVLGAPGLTCLIYNNRSGVHQACLPRLHDPWLVGAFTCKSAARVQAGHYRLTTGKDQFNWEDVKNAPDREYYLGHSVKASAGRWQKGALVGHSASSRPTRTVSCLHVLESSLVTDASNPMCVRLSV